MYAEPIDIDNSVVMAREKGRRGLGGGGQRNGTSLIVSTIKIKFKKV